jgi:hypothetical protein
MASFSTTRNEHDFTLGASCELVLGRRHTGDAGSGMPDINVRVVAFCGRRSSNDAVMVCYMHSTVQDLCILVERGIAPLPCTRKTLLQSPSGAAHECMSSGDLCYTHSVKAFSPHGESLRQVKAKWITVTSPQ